MIGSSVAHYRVTGELGAGGMGIVYRARDLRLQRDVALKFPSPNLLGSRRAIERFEQEARSAAAINHPNICTVYEVGEHEQTPYISMELLEGETLSSKLRGAMLPLDHLLEWAIQTAAGLEAAHQRGIVHRDLKPSNIFVTNGAMIKILDFGLAELRTAKAARAAEAVTQSMDMDDADATGPRQLPGTPAYMSPEQVRGDDLDPRTDLFSLGIVLYEMATGKCPFEGATTGSIMAAVLARTPDPASKLRRDLPPQFEQILQKALEKDREVRYQTAADIRADLKRLRRDSGWRENAAFPARAGRPRRQLRSLVLAGSAATAVALAAVALWIWPLKRPLQFLEHAEVTQLTSTGEVLYAAISPDGKYLAYSTGRAKSSLRLRQVAAGTDVQLLAPGDVFYPGIAFTPDSSYVYYQVGKNGTTDIELFSIPVLGGEPRFISLDAWSAPAFSPDGSRIAFMTHVAGEGRLVLANADGSNKRAIARLDRGERFTNWSFPSWSPDGNLIALSLTRGGHSYAGTVPVDGGRRQIVGRTDWWRLESPKWILGGGGLVFAGSFGPTPTQVWEMSYPDGEARQITSDLAQYRKVVPSADARTLSAVRISASSAVWLASRAPAGQPEPAPHRVTNGSARVGWRGLTWLADGRLVYSLETGRNQDVAISTAEPGPLKQLTHGESVTGGIDAHGTDFIVYSAYDHSRRRLWRIDPEGRERISLALDAISPACSPDGNWVYFASTTASDTGVGIWKVSSRGGKPIAVTPEGIRPRLSPDGKLLAYVRQGARNELVIVPASGGSAIHVFQLGGISTYLFNWAPGGQAIDFVRTDQDDGTIWRIPVQGGTPARLLSFGSGVIWNLVWSRDGKQLAIAEGERTEDAVLIRSE